ncbi:MAG: YgfZ/GcvT domain-containing protein [Leptospirillia bacterium]
MQTDVPDTRRAHTHAGFFLPKTSRSLLLVSGEDRISYLQGLLCQDISTQRPGTLRYGFFLNPKARILFDSWIAARPDDLLLSPSGEKEEDFMAHLKKYLFFRTKAKITSLSGDFRSLTLVGREAPALATPLFSKDPAEDGYRTLSGGGFAFLRPHRFAFERDAGPWIDLWIPQDSFEKTARDLKERVLSAGGMSLDAEALEAYRIERGIPLLPFELNEGHFPAEAGLDTVAVSYNKGCYVGQEPVTRLKFQGQLSRRLTGLRSKSPDLKERACPRPLFSSLDGSEAGTLTSLAPSRMAGSFLGLGYVKRAHWEPGTALVDGEGQPFEVSDFPFISLE